ncbi:cupin domain-containing protein [Acinetobacter oleivorans]
MEMHQFCYDRDIRIVLCNLKDSLFPFHRHTHIPDLVYCSKGAIQVELPDLKQKYIVNQGDFFQIPPNVRHRFANKDIEVESRYIILQIGEFSIEFFKNIEEIEPLLANIEPKTRLSSDIFIKDYNADIQYIIEDFQKNRKKEISTEEQADIIQALEVFLQNGYKSKFPEKSYFFA